MEALEVMNGMHADINQLEETYSKGWRAIAGLISLYRLMHPFTGITKKLQGRSTDVVKAFNKVESVVNHLGAYEAI